MIHQMETEDFTSITVNLLLGPQTCP